MGVRKDKIQVEVEINGKKAGASINDLTKTYRQLNRERNKMTIGTDEWIKKTAEIKKVKGRLDEVRKSTVGVKNGFLGLGKIGGQIAKTIGITFLISKFKEWGTAIFSVTDEYSKLRKEIKRASGESGEQLDELIETTAALGRTFGVENNKISLAAKTLTKNLGGSYKENLAIIEKGLLAAGDNQDEFLDQLKEYPSALRDAKVGSEELVAIITQSSDQGIFSDKGIDTIKEFGLRIREQTKTTSDAMRNAFGDEFTNEIFGGINDGSITVVDAMQRISKQMSDTKLPANELQTVIADVFGGPGEDAGGAAFVENLHNMQTNMDGLVDTTDNYTKNQQEQLRLNKELSEAQNELAKEFEGVGNVLGGMFTKALTGVISMVTGLVQGIKWLFGAGKDYSDGLNEQVEALQNERVEMNANFELLKKNNVSQKKRAEIMASINDKYGKYLPNLISEESSINDLSAAQKILNDEQLKNISIKQQQAKMTELMNEQAEIVNDQTREQLEQEKLTIQAEQEIQRLKAQGAKDDDFRIKMIRNGIEARKEFGNFFLGIQDKQIEGLEEEKALEQEITKKLEEKYNVSIDTLGLQDSIMNTMVENAKKAGDIDIERVRKQKSASQKQVTDSKAAAQKIQDLELELLGESIEKKIIQIDVAAEREKATLVGTSKQIAEQSKLIDEKANKDKEQAHREFLKKKQEDATKAGAERIKQIEDEQKIENAKRLAVSDLALFHARNDANLLLQEQLKRIGIERDIELQNLNLTEEQKAALKAEFRQKELDLIGEHNLQVDAKQQESIARKAGYLQDAIGHINDFAQLAGDREIQRTEEYTEKQLNLLETQLQSKSINEEQFAKKKEAIENTSGKMIAGIRRKQAKADKAARISSAIANTAVAVTAGLAKPAIPPFPSAIAAGIFGGIQVAKIASEPIPNFYHGGHTGTKPIAYDSNGPIVGGVHANEWVAPDWMTTHPEYGQRIAYLEAVRSRGFAEGGFTTPNLSGTSGDPGQVVQNTDKNFQLLVNEMRGIRNDVKTWNSKLQAYISYEQLSESTELVDSIISDSTA